MLQFARVVFSLLALTSLAQSQQAELLADILDAPAYGGNSSIHAYGTTGSGHEFAQVGGWRYFQVNEPEHGAELWRSLGTAASTELVVDIDPGPVGSYPGAFCAWGQLLFFFASPRPGGRALYVSTGKGAVSLLDIGDGQHSYFFEDLIEWSGGIAFVTDRDGRRELWVSDGTQKGTRVLLSNEMHDIHPFCSLSWCSARSEFWFLEGVPSALDGRIWTFDPKSAKLALLPGAKAPLHLPYGYEKHRSILFSGTHAFWLTKQGLTQSQASLDVGHLVSYDLQAATEHVLTQAPVAPDFSYAKLMGRQLYFFSAFEKELELWRSDGTKAGTALVKKLGAGLTVASALHGERAPERWVSWQGKQLFGVGRPASGNTPANHLMLWSTDGTAAGTQPMPHALPSPNSEITLLSTGTELYASIHAFTPVAPITGTPQVLRWTAQGWHAIRRGKPGDLTVHGRDMAVLANGDLLFDWGDYSTESPQKLGSGVELCAYDPVRDAVRVIRKWKHPMRTESASQIPLCSGESWLFGTCYSATGPNRIWSYDSRTGKTTVAVLSAESLWPSADLASSLGSRLFFFAPHTSTGWELRSWEASEATDKVVLDIRPGAASSVSMAPRLVRSLGELVFVANDGVHGNELWATDGTAKGTRMLFDHAKGQLDGVDEDTLVALGSKLLFCGENERPGLWSYDRIHHKSTLLMSLPKAVEVHGRVAMRVGAQALIGVQVYAWPRSVRSMILLSDGTQGAVRVLLDRTDASYPSGWFGAVSVCEDRLVLAWEDSNATQLRRIHGDGRVERIPAYDTLTWAKEISAFVESREGLVLSSAKAQSGHWHWIESGKTVRPWLKERTFAGDVYQIKELGGGREWGRNRWSGFVRDKATGAMRWLEPSLSISRAFLHAGLVTHIGYWRQGDPQFLLGNELYGVALQGGSHAIGGPCGARPLYLRSDDPVLGTIAGIDLRYAEPQSPAVLFLGGPVRLRSMLFGRCVAAFDTYGFHLPIAVWLTGKAGEAKGQLGIPNDPSFTGQHFVLQALSLDTSGQPSASNGVRLVLGPNW